MQKWTVTFLHLQYVPYVWMIGQIFFLPIFFFGWISQAKAVGYVRMFLSEELDILEYHHMQYYVYRFIIKISITPSTEILPMIVCTAHQDNVVITFSLNTIIYHMAYLISFIKQSSNIKIY